MSHLHDQLLKRLCNNSQTLAKAKEILHAAGIRTAQGSGYELGQGVGGLPAICAYLAAEELGDTDISEKISQNASCLKPKVFKTTLNTVRAALAAAAAASSSRKSSRNVTYRQLVEEYKFGRKGMVVQWMEDAERTLMENREIRRRNGSAYDAITLSVFFWTCGHMQSKKKINTTTLLDRYNVSRDQFDQLTEALHELCTEVESDIKETIASLKTGGTSTAQPKGRSTRATSTKAPPEAPPAAELTFPPIRASVESSPAPIPRSPSKSPTKSALRAPSVGLTPTKTPNHKRKVAFDGPIPEEDEEFDALATPSKKRQKLASEAVAASPLKALPTPRASARLAAHQHDEKPEREHPAPSTPRRQRTLPPTPSSTHSNRSARSARSGTGAGTGSVPSTPRRKSALPTVHEEGPPRRRCRPVFADQQQWLRGDARLERELRPWADKWRELVRSAGGDVWKAAGMARSAEVRVGK